ncbi:DUF971 domain-containing protein [Microvenator marinus]|uniref:DUF971 domain-containing protein n=1 Tax=Microvenator marinus TaxID=2600177 RepID=A0A5B8XZY4_9DELT|nr:DUF971 domain-containing protein [Microvenator marinus]QED28969.1 DUF971 domain-containing protein [Microvenator marinus]
MGSTPHPTEVEYLSASGELRVLFSDGYEVKFSSEKLRGYCPCAHCQGHSGGPLKWNPIRTPLAAQIRDVSAVGNYGMCIAFEDGHDTGIYAFDVLRDEKSVYAG